MIRTKESNCRPAPWLLSVLLLSPVTPALAAPPDAGQMLESLRPLPAPSVTDAQLPEVVDEAVQGVDTGPRIVVRGLRISGQSVFSDAELNQLAARITGHYRQLLLSHGLLVASAPLTPVERRVLQSLMTGLSEKEIAAAQGQSYHTTHGYVVAIFRKFGVNNRSALMALWLGRTQ